jgi:hypothetical protein
MNDSHAAVEMPAPPIPRGVTVPNDRPPWGGDPAPPKGSARLG